jgi:hypothetical protein
MAYFEKSAGRQINAAAAVSYNLRSLRASCREVIGIYHID